MNEFSIVNIEIGEKSRALVIPEIGINHGGSLKVAKEMVDAAFRAGARLVKFQCHIVSDEMSREAKKVIPGNADISIYEIMENCSLSKKEEYELFQYVKDKGMVFLSTPFSRAAADRLQDFGVSAFKIGSGELNNYPLIDHVASFGKPMIVSTGMNDIQSIQKTVDILDSHNVKYALLHTTNLYPTDPSLIRLGAMQEMMAHFKNVPIGLSDHSLTNTACIAAMALGARIVERHFTDVKTRQGPDIICSMDEKELAELIQASSDVHKMLGGHKEAAKEEQVTIDFAFASIVSIKPIMKGEILTKDNIWVKRPGKGGICAEKYNEVLGREAVVDIEEDVQLSRDMFN